MHIYLLPSPPFAAANGTRHGREKYRQRHRNNNEVFNFLFHYQRGLPTRNTKFIEHYKNAACADFSSKRLGLKRDASNDLGLALPDFAKKMGQSGGQGVTKTDNT